MLFPLVAIVSVYAANLSLLSRVDTETLLKSWVSSETFLKSETLNAAFSPRPDLKYAVANVFGFCTDSFLDHVKKSIAGNLNDSLLKSIDKELQMMTRIVRTQDIEIIKYSLSEIIVGKAWFRGLFVAAIERGDENVLLAVWEIFVKFVMKSQGVKEEVAERFVMCNIQPIHPVLEFAQTLKYVEYVKNLDMEGLRGLLPKTTKS